MFCIEDGEDGEHDGALNLGLIQCQSCVSSLFDVTLELVSELHFNLRQGSATAHYRVTLQRAIVPGFRFNLCRVCATTHYRVTRDRAGVTLQLMSGLRNNSCQ